TEHVVGSTEMVLRAQRHRLLFDGAGLGATGGAYAVVELVGGAPQLHSEIVVDVVAGAQGRGRAAIELVDALGRIALGLQQAHATHHGEALAGRTVSGSVLRECGGRHCQGGKRGKAENLDRTHGELLVSPESG